MSWRLFALYLLAAALFALAVVLDASLSGCGGAIAPLPPGAIACGNSFTDCPDGMHCGFPGVNTHAQCLQGPEEFDDYPPPVMLRRRDGGSDGGDADGR